MILSMLVLYLLFGLSIGDNKWQSYWPNKQNTFVIFIKSQSSSLHARFFFFDILLARSEKEQAKRRGKLVAQLEEGLELL